jgi:outer membrane protein assembly factor BamB
VHRAVPPQPIHLKNSHASESPVTDGERVYAYIGSAGVFCLDMEGHTIWSNSLPAHKMRYGWGTAASPALDRERLYLVSDNEEDSYLLALDKRTGKELWPSAPR